MARNAWFGVALLALTTVAACGGEAVEAKAAAAAQAQVAKVRARTDSLRQARDRQIAAAADSRAGRRYDVRASLAGHRGRSRPSRRAADTLAQVEAALADSVQRAREIEVMRETFAYAGGTRDPFTSLIDKDSDRARDRRSRPRGRLPGPPRRRPTTSSCCGRRARREAPQDAGGRPAGPVAAGADPAP